jgi:hypothetical protein
MSEIEEFLRNGSSEVRRVPVVLYTSLGVRVKWGFADVFRFQGQQIVLLEEEEDSEVNEVVLRKGGE